jgi:hypothetical protein
MRKFMKWMLTISLSMFVLPFSACVGTSIDGVVQSFVPCDVLNCQNPTFFDPCMWLQCQRPGPGGGGGGTTTTGGTTTGETTTGGTTTGGTTTGGTTGGQVTAR